MRIPIFDEPKAQSRPLGAPFENTNFDTGQGAVARGLDQLGAGIEHADEAYQRAKHKADVVGGNDLVTQFTHYNTDELIGSSDPAFAQGDPGNPQEPKPSPNGFLSTRGAEAHEKSVDTLTRIQKRAEQLAASAPNDAQRQLFLSTAQRMIEDTRHQVESHVSQQTTVAQQASLAARIDADVRWAAANPLDDKGLEARSAEANGPVRALQLSEEDGTRTLALREAKVADARIDALLSAGQWAKAQDVLDKSKGSLGDAGPQLQAKVNGAKKTWETAQRDLAAGQQAQGIIQRATDASGVVDEGKALAEWNVLPEGPLKKSVESEIHIRAAAFNAAQAQQEKQTLGRVFQGIERSSGRVDEGSADFNALSDWGKGQALERGKAIQRQLRTTDAEARRAQAEANRIAINGFNALPLEEQVKAAPVVLFPGADRATHLYIDALKKKAVGLYEKGQAPSVSEFDSQVKATAKQLEMRKEDAADFVSHMAGWRSKWLEENNGKLPSRKDVAAALKDALLYGDSAGGGWRSYFSGNRFKFRNEAGEPFKPFGASEQPYAPNKNPAVPAVAAPPAAPATKPPPGARKGPDGRWYTRGANGEGVPVP